MASPTPLRLKRWTAAGLLLTYWCNARCAFCYVYSGPNKKGPAMTVNQALDYWRGLNNLIDEGGPNYHGVRCKVHLAGGEPFYDFDKILAIATAAKTLGFKVFEKVETNAFWAQDDDETRRKIQLLADAGMQMLMISSDVYHQEFVPVERCVRAARIAREILGEQGVRVRWWDFIDQPVDIAAMPVDERRKMYAQALERHKERLTGRAADMLADQFECHPPEHFQTESCVSATLGSKHVHIDGYGNVFPGVCSGIVWGQISPDPSRVGSQLGSSTPSRGGEQTTHEQPTPHDQPPTAAPDAEGEPTAWPDSFPSIEDLWRYASQNWRQHPIIGRVVEGGSYSLYLYAKSSGYQPRPGGYANKCHLCHDVRRWLYENGHFGNTLGPGEVYAEQSSPPRPESTRVSLPILS